jgi:tRNA U34 5-methylaminomethyl-2-thiouridine-forming methyltransferase MnmC
MKESNHVFIKAGFDAKVKDVVKILEMGFGTGLNAYLTLYRANESGKKVIYHGIEKNPLDIELISRLSYPFYQNCTEKELFLQLHHIPWNSPFYIVPNFQLMKINEDLLSFNPTEIYDLVYYDAFSPEKQPELWTEDIFSKINKCMGSGAILVTYCARGEIKRRLKRTGFIVESIPGPPGKREMVRAIKQ